MGVWKVVFRYPECHPPFYAEMLTRAFRKVVFRCPECRPPSVMEMLTPGAGNVVVPYPEGRLPSSGMSPSFVRGDANAVCLTGRVS